MDQTILSRDYKLQVITVLFIVGTVLADGPSDALLAHWNTPKAFSKLAPHPRLFVTSEQIQRMVSGRGQQFEGEYQVVDAAAETGVKDAEEPLKGVSPFHRGLIGQGRLTALAIQWLRTKDRTFLEAAVTNIKGMKQWLHFGQHIQLWDGQYLAGIAIAYDLLYHDLTKDERQVIVDVGRHFIRCWLKRTVSAKGSAEGEHQSWWMGRVANWNPVCAAGAGMLGLAMYEELDEAQTAVDRVKQSFKPIFDEIEKTEGGWVEGLGYWNWTMHYISLFGISDERATNTEYPEFRSDGFRKTLTFGTYFVPHRIPCGFGDNQHGRISSSLLAAAEHLGYEQELNRLRDHYRRMGFHLARKPAKEERHGFGNIGYGPPQDLLIQPSLNDVQQEPVKKMVKYYPTQGWGMIADQWPKPTVYASVRGGICAGDHTQADLLSWYAVIGGEEIIHNIHWAIYEPTGFRGRATDIYERNQTSKNTLFVAGISAYTGSNSRFGGPARATTTPLNLPFGPAIHMDARNAFNYGSGRHRPKVLSRLFAVLEDKALLVLDRVESSPAVPVEARSHTRKKATFGKDFVVFQGDKGSARMTCASDKPFVLRQAVALSTRGQGEPPTMMRLQSLRSERAVTLATLLTPGADPVQMTVTSDKDTVTVEIQAKDWQKTVALTLRLKPITKKNP